jgi:hypothetical protein
MGGKWLWGLGLWGLLEIAGLPSWHRVAGRCAAGIGWLMAKFGALPNSEARCVRCFPEQSPGTSIYLS